MPLTAKEAFKVGALARMVEEGLTPDQMLARVKTAHTKLALTFGEGLALTKALGGAGGTAAGVTGKALGGLWTAGKLGLGVGLAAPPILGGLAGYGLARATDISDTDVDELKDRELLSEYQRQTEHLRRQRALRDHYQQQRAGQRPGRNFG
jgi:hypothetical protein